MFSPFIVSGIQELVRNRRRRNIYLSFAVTWLFRFKVRREKITMRDVKPVVQRRVPYISRGRE